MSARRPYVEKRLTLFRTCGTCGKTIVTTADTSPVVNVVYLSAGERLRDGHVIIRTRDGLSMAHCENVYSVDKCRLGTYVGRCSKEEMARIDAAIARALGLPVPTPKPETPDTAAVERDIYRKICEGMLNRVLLDRKETE